MLWRHPFVYNSNRQYDFEGHNPTIDVFDIVISGVLSWHEVDHHRLSGYSMLSGSSGLTPEEVHLLCLQTTGCLSVYKSGSRYYLNNITRLDAGESWEENSGWTFYDIFYATKGKFYANILFHYISVAPNTNMF